jgi:A/G-specific adenine glycosylase
MVILQKTAGEVLLEQRPAEGIWGGLWSFPECPDGVDPIDWCREQLRCSPKEVRYGTSLRHTLTHCHLDLFPLYIRVQRVSRTVMESGPYVWYNNTQALGLAAPVNKLLKSLLTPE